MEWWIGLGWIPVAHQAILTPPPEESSEENKMTNSCVEINAVWEIKTKAVHGSKTKEKVLLSTSCQQEMAIHPGSRGSVLTVIVLKDNHINNECSHLLLSLSFILMNMTSYGMEYAFVQFGSALLAVPPSSPLPTPRLPACGSGVWVERAWMLWEQRWAGIKTLMCPQHQSSYSCKAEHYMGCWREIYLHALLTYTKQTVHLESYWTQQNILTRS